MAELEAVLADIVGAQRAVVERLLADGVTAASDLLHQLGGTEGLSRRGGDGSGVRMPGRVSKDLAKELVAATGLDTVTAAVEAGHRRDAVARTGWPFTRWARRLRPHPLRRLHLDRGTAGRSSLPQPSGAQRVRAEAAIRDAAALVSDGLPSPWPDLVLDAATPDEGVLDDRLDAAVSEAVRDHRSRDPRWWRAVGAVQGLLAMAAVTGAAWLGLLAFGAYLRLPDPPTPEWRGIPIPTGLLIGGVLLGLLVAAVASRVAAMGGRQRARAVRGRAEDSVRRLSEELVIEPMKAELTRRRELHRLLLTAGAKP